MQEQLQNNEDLKKYEFKEHWVEFRTRIFLCVITFMFFTCGSYIYAEQIYAFLTRPLLELYSPESNRRLIYTNLTEAFFTYLKVSCYAGFFFSFPLIAFQFYFFLAPGLYKKERRALLPILFFAPILFFLGAYIVYVWVMPLAWKFFLSFENYTPGKLPIMLEAKVGEYLELVLDLMVGFGLAFQLPIILTLLAKVGIVKGSWLASKRKYAIVLIFIVAAILTPPDIISQIALALPMLLLYEISVVICKAIEKARTKNYA